MPVEAESLGANAVISVQFETPVIMGGAAEMMGYGPRLSWKSKTYTSGNTQGLRHSDRPRMALA